MRAAGRTHSTQRLARLLCAGRFGGLLFCCVAAVDWILLAFLKAWRPDSAIQKALDLPPYKFGPRSPPAASTD
eukprot:scaffold3884_cov392-Prasinococcus_capsulatus_cf.AAC.14